MSASGAAMRNDANRAGNAVGPCTLRSAVSALARVRTDLGAGANVLHAAVAATEEGVDAGQLEEDVALPRQECHADPRREETPEHRLGDAPPGAARPRGRARRRDLVGTEREQ